MATTAYYNILQGSFPEINSKSYWYSAAGIRPLESNDGIINMRIRGPIWWTSGSSNKYNHLLNAFWVLTNYTLGYEGPNVQNWAVQKKNPVIKAGLNKACSKIRPVYFDTLRNHTNAVEQSHQKSYALGKYLTLVQAVKKYFSTTICLIYTNYL